MSDGQADPPELPIRDIGDARLADHLGRPGCPVCRIRVDAGTRYLEAVLWESVNDVGFRARLDRGRGFCRRHAREVLTISRAKGGLLGGGILLGAALKVRLAELEADTAQRRRPGRKDIAAARRAADCPVCEQVATAERGTIETFVGKLADPAWRSTVAGAEFCLDDLLLMWEAALRSVTPHWTDVATSQIERIRELAERLDAFAYHSSFDRRHLQTDAERRAPEEAARFLGGSGRGIDPPRG